MRKAGAERGNMLPLVVMSVLALIAIVAFSVDQGIAYAVKAHQENALDAARSACMDASFALVAKSAENPGALMAERVARTLQEEGIEGSATVWFYETPAESMPASERLWTIGIQVQEQAKTVFSRGFGIEGLPVASWRVMTARPYAGEVVWRPKARICGRFDATVASDDVGLSFRVLSDIDLFPLEVIDAAESALPDGPRL